MLFSDYMSSFCGDCMIVSKLVVACGHINVLNEESHFHPIRDLANDPSSNKTEADILPFILLVKNQTSTLIRFYGTVWSTIWRRKRKFHIKSWSLNAKWYLEANKKKQPTDPAFTFAWIKIVSLTEENSTTSSIVM